MSQSAAVALPAFPPHVQLIQMCAGGWVAAAVYAAAKLGLADHLAGGARGADDLAVVTRTHAPSLYRFMRTLAHFGILSEEADQRFALTPLGAALKSDAPGRARSTLIAFGSTPVWRAWEEILYSLETGKPGFDKVWGMGFFDHLARNPEAAAHFSDAMVGFHGAEPPTVADAYDFAGVQTVVDVGGSSGNLLVALLTRHPHLRGILFDLPHVVRDVPAKLQAQGLDARVTIESGSFFDSVPAGGDAYVLSHIIHDWTEEQCLTILGHCRRAMNPDSRLLIVETVLPEGNTPHQGKLQDLVMLVFPGGQERTAAEYETLLSKAGFRLTRVVPTTSVVSIVEAVPE